MISNFTPHYIVIWLHIHNWNTFIEHYSQKIKNSDKYLCSVLVIYYCKIAINVGWQPYCYNNLSSVCLQLCFAWFYFGHIISYWYIYPYSLGLIATSILKAGMFIDKNILIFNLSHLRVKRGNFEQYDLSSPWKLTNSRTLIKLGQTKPLQWRHNEHDGVWNHQPYGCLLNRLFSRRSKKTSKIRVTGLCEGNAPVTGEFPAQRTSNAVNIAVWWRHHAWELRISQGLCTRFVLYCDRWG